MVAIQQVQPVSAAGQAVRVVMSRVVQPVSRTLVMVGEAEEAEEVFMVEAVELYNGATAVVPAAAAVHHTDQWHRDRECIREIMAALLVPDMAANRRASRGQAEESLSHIHRLRLRAR